MQHLARCVTFFEILCEKLDVKLAMIHTAKDHFTKISRGKVSGVNFQVDLVPNKSGIWETLSDSSIHAILSRYFCPYNKTMLDPFCGSGHFLKVAKSLGMDVIGIDNDKDQIEVAESGSNLSVIKKPGDRGHESEGLHWWDV